MYEADQTAKRIKAYARSKGILLKDLLEDCSLNKNFLFTMQARKSWPSVHSIAKVADYLNCTVDYLLGNTDAPNAVPSAEGIELTRSEEEIIKLFRQMDKEQGMRAILALQRIILDYQGKEQE